MRDTVWIFFVIGFLALTFEYMDATIGMGFGTTLTPILLLIGFLPLEVVPAVLIGQLAGGVVGGIAHSKLGNVKFDFKNDIGAVTKFLKGRGYIPKSNDSKVVMVLGIFGIIGAFIGVITAVNIPKLYLNIYIGLMVLSIGIWILVKRNRNIQFSWLKLSIIGIISAFNKGISGGGYGPLVTGGQIVSGKDAKSSVGNTTLVESVICIVAFLSYFILKVDIYWKLALATSVGSILAAPLAAFTVKKVKAKRLVLLIGIVTILLGLFTIIKILI
jgi:uncharacterized membrane protein YfcA